MQNLRMRQILTVFLATITFLFSSAFGYYGNQVSALAETLTPEAGYYQTPGGEDVQNAAKNLARDTKRATTNAVEDSQEGIIGKLEDTAENIVEKLNLNEPLPRSTKEFLNDVPGSTKEVLENPKETYKNATE